jgi:hypothetical protein
VSSILQTRSGLPENIQVVSGFFGNPMRPDYVSGQPLWLSQHSWPNASYNPAAFQLEPNFLGVWGHDIGSVGRNALRAPAFFQWDMSAMKTIPVTERVHVQFRADFFNTLNHPNFTNPDGGICTSITYTATSGTCVPNPNFGRSSQTIADVAGGAIGNGTARQVQFSLKLMF